MKNDKLKIALFVGGASSEREVSKLSSKSIYSALLNLGHEVILIDPALGDNQYQNQEDYFLPDKDVIVSTQNYAAAVASIMKKNIDLAFLGLHGKWGEDGTIQSLLELCGIKYTGSGVLASALSMDKGKAKIIFKDNGVSVPKGLVITKSSYSFKDLLESIKMSLGFPIVVKPNDEGSTMGLTICDDETEIEKAIEFSFKYSNKTIIEEFIHGRELTVGILDDKVLPLLEIKPKHELYDFECKYTTGMSEYIVPAQVDEDTFKHIQDQALKAYRSLGCKGYARADFRLSPEGKSYCLEVNTLPGMTSTSLIPKMAKAIGISFEELIAKIVNLSLKNGS
jgi:D-alanine-D-alanine ligase